MSLSVVNYLNISYGRLITTVGKERAVFSSIDYSYFYCFCSKKFPFPLDAWEGLHFIVILHRPSI